MIILSGWRVDIIHQRDLDEQSMCKRSSVTVLLIVITIISACNYPSDNKVKTSGSSLHSGARGATYPVDPIFLDFYESLGGEKLFGPAISPLIESGQIKSQFVEAALFTYDPSRPEGDQYQLASLGVILGISEPPVDQPDSPDFIYLNGHIIFPEFLPLYNSLGAERVVGRPLSEARHNPAKERIEQYFENLGFYRYVFDPPGTVRLLAYGAYACDFACQYTPASASIPSLQGFLPQPFSLEAARLGIGVTGLTLAGPHLAADGKLEVIFENVVMVLETEKRRPDYEFSFHLWLPEILFGRPLNPLNFPHQSWLPLVINFRPQGGTVAQQEILRFVIVPIVIKSGPPMRPYVTLRPIARMIGVVPDTPVEKEDNPLMVFYRIRGQKGYHVPLLFDQFLKQYGGIRFSGSPITQPFMLEEGIYRQCFENLCLDFNVLDPGLPRIRIAPLGVAYQRIYSSQIEIEVHTNMQNGVELSAREMEAYASREQPMTIQVEIKREGKPSGGQRPYVILTMVDKTQQLLQFEPTDQNGLTSLQLPIIPAPNATIIPYQVCLDLLGSEPVCIEDHYLIFYPE